MGKRQKRGELVFVDIVMIPFPVAHGYAASRLSLFAVFSQLSVDNGCPHPPPFSSLGFFRVKGDVQSKSRIWYREWKWAENVVQEQKRKEDRICMVFFFLSSDFISVKYKKTRKKSFNGNHDTKPSIQRATNSTSTPLPTHPALSLGEEILVAGSLGLSNDFLHLVDLSLGTTEGTELDVEKRSGLAIFFFSMSSVCFM